MDAWLNAPTDEDDVLSAVSAFEHAGVELNLTIRRIAAGMVTAVAKGNSNSWREAARKSTQSGRIHALLRDELNGPTGDVFWSYVSRQADLIRSIPGDLAFEAQQYIAERKVAGERADTIADALRRKFPAMKAAKVALISRTGVASTATAISRSRSERLNLNWYEWDTSEDARVRRSHRLMDLVLVNWNDPPAPEALAGIKSKLGRYHAGNCPNCRCDANVLVDLEQVSWPHKVFHHGVIQRMTKAAFRVISGMAA
jgi:hypothetical protein